MDDAQHYQKLAGYLQFFSLPLKEEHLFVSGEVEEEHDSEPSEGATDLVGR